MVLLGIFFSSMGIGLSGALMPGPMLSVTVAESYKKGFWAGPLLVVGHAIPELRAHGPFRRWVSTASSKTTRS